MSHTQTETLLPEQELVDRYLPQLDLPHRLRHESPITLGGLVWPQQAGSLRLEIDEALERAPAVFEDCRQAFIDVFERDPGAAIEAFATADAELVLVASGSIATTAREVVRQRRAAGERIGLVKVKMFRPFPEREIREACATATRLGVLDRNYAAGVGGVFWHDLRAAFQGHRDDLMIQGYLTGLCGGDVTSESIDEVLADLAGRERPGRPVWVGIDAGEEAN